MAALLRADLHSCSHMLVPRALREAVVYGRHRDAVGHRADDLAEVTAYALRLINDRR